jgi:P pilus assembly chaperone PapD
VQNQQWRGHITPDGRVLLTVSNLGNVHQVVNEIKLRYADVSIDSPSLATIKDSVAILPKQSHQWELHPTQKLKGHNFMLEVGTDQDSQHVALDLDQL